jgi:hypothetical protein
MRNAKLLLPMCAAGLLLAGCGLAETTVVAGAGGASAAEQARQARQQQQEVRDDVAKAQKEAADKLAAAEAAAE